METAAEARLSGRARLAEPEDLSGSESALSEPLTAPAAAAAAAAATNGERPVTRVAPPAVPPSDDDEESLRFGWGGCTPDCLQPPMLSQRTFLVVFVVTCVLQGMYYTYVVSVLTTIEKLFQFPSKTTGIVYSATEIGQISGALLLTYYGGQGHRPRWIGCGVALFAVCTVACSLPHFAYSGRLARLDALSVTGNGSDASAMCRALPVVTGDTVSETVLFPDEVSGLEVEEPGCEDNLRTTTYAEVQRVVLVTFIVCLIGVGVGQTMAFNLGIPYMDDNVSSKESPMYFAFIIGLRIFGPVFGFLLGSLCTSLYVYPTETPDITPRDPRWIGAWWLGMFIISGMLALNAVIMFGFPRRLPRRKRVAGSPAIAACSSPAPSPAPARSSPSLREFPKAVNNLLKNDVLMCRTASNVLHALPIAGLYTFLPKYLETQFRMTANAANVTAGIGGILVMFLGILASGVYIRRYQPSARFITGWIAGSALLYSVGMVLLMFVGCPQDDIAGLQTGGSSSLVNLTCSAHCQCLPGEFAPVCGSDGLTYLSPCLAGCSSALQGKLGGPAYEDCSCIGSDSGAESFASMSYCPLSCDNFYWFIPVFCVFVLIHSTSEVGAILVTLRCVSPHEKALALGFIAVAIGLFANVPCPIIYGAVVDSACLLWKTNCGQRGACLLYDAVLFRRYFFGITGGVMFAAFLVDCVVWYKADKINAGLPAHEQAAAGGRTPPPETVPLKQAP